MPHTDSSYGDKKIRRRRVNRTHIEDLILSASNGQLAEPWSRDRRPEGSRREAMDANGYIYYMRHIKCLARPCEYHSRDRGRGVDSD